MNHKANSHLGKLLLAVVTLSTGALQADTLSDNLSTISAGTRTATGSTLYAAKFSTGSAAVTLTSITLSLARTTTFGSANLFIYSDTDGNPGALVGVLTAPATYSTTLASTTFTSSTGILLSASASYYAVLQSNAGSFAWSFTTSTAGTGPGFQPIWSVSTDNASTWTTTSGQPFQMQTTTIANSGCSIVLGSPGINLTSASSTNSVSVTTTPVPCAWTSASSVGWITILPGSFGTGSGTVSFFVEENTTLSSRAGTINIGGQTYTVTQSASSVACPFVLSSTSLSVDAAGTASSFVVNTNTGCAFLASTSDSFISITGGASGSSSAPVFFSVAPNTNSSSRTGTITVGGNTFTITQAGTSGGPNPGGLLFVPVTPCRVLDTRLIGPAGAQLATGETRSVPVPSSACGIPSNAAAYSVNLTVVPAGPLAYVTLFPSGQAQPFVSTLNSDGRIKANAAIVPAGSNGAISIFASNPTHVVLDINGYFVPNTGLAFYPVTPCRIADTRLGVGALGGPRLSGGQTRTIPVLSSACGIPSTAQAYSLNMTVVPNGALSYLSTWPAGQAQPLVSTLNSFTGATTANAAIVPAGTNGAINVFATDNTDLVIDVNGYFAPPGAGGLRFFTLQPCRVSDTRLQTGPFGGPSMMATQTRSYALPSSACGVPTSAQAYSLNATVLPQTTLGFLTLYPLGVAQPLVSTLNADASVVANAAIVRAGTNGAINAFVTDLTELILDINGYFAQ